MEAIRLWLSSVVPASANVRRTFLPWDRPLLPQAVEWLAAGWNGAGPLDLSGLLVVVPTAQSGRRLREALAEHAGARGQAVFPPRVQTPEALSVPGRGTEAASRVDSLIAWAEIFRGLDLAAFREVFPLDPPIRNYPWALRLAEEFVGLQATLAEAGLRLGDVAAKAGGDFPEAGRWRQLGDLERRYDQALGELGRRDPQAAKIAAAQDPAPLLGIRRIVVIATPDPLPLALATLAGHARTIPVDIVIFAPPAEAEAFDGWGRPQVAAWERRELALPDFERRVHLCADPSAQADRITELARAYGEPDGRLGIGIADPEVLPILESALGRTRVASFNPGGRARRSEGLYHLLAALAALVREPAFEAVESLGRCPDFLAFLAARFGDRFSPSDWLEGLDQLRSRHLPSDLAAARAHAAGMEQFPRLAPALDAVEEVRAALGAGTFAAGAAGALGMIYAGRRLDLERESDGRLEDAAAAWTEVVRECASSPAALPTAEWWDLALRIFGGGVRTEDKPAGALELQGWLELLWEDAPHLAVAGCNDGSIPDAVAGDPFLPETLRGLLGLKTNAARFARDNYQLAALIGCRAHGGRIELLLGRVSVVGEPRQPSRLLLRCASAELPRRVEFLFRAVQAARNSPPWRRAWQLRPPLAPRLTRLSVTAFRDYLRCPFRFYLKHALRLTTIDPQKSELDPLDFGTLCHAALEGMGREPSLRDCTDPSVLRTFLLDALDRAMRSRYGRELTLPLIIQLESARQRLARAAEIQAEQRSLGWVIEHTEEKIALEIGGLIVGGKIDRIERHLETGRQRVLDYKTSDRPIPPLAAHCRRPIRGAETAPEFARFTLGGKDLVWIDLQLPLYLDALSKSAGSPDLAGYFNLPKAVGETAVATWDDYDDDWRAAARRCAEGVASAVEAGVFWPPAEPGARDEALFAGYFHQGTAASVDPAFAGEGCAR